MASSLNYIPLLSAGAKAAFGIETVAGTMPSSMEAIYGAKSIPASTNAPSAKETTDLSCTEFKTYMAGLQDLGGAMAITSNFSQKLVDQWNGFCDNAATAREADKASWLVIAHPGIDKAVAYQIQPVKIYMPEMAVDELNEIDLNYVQMSEPDWVTKPTISEPSASDAG
ncbi:MAG: hypothetical protein Q4F79_12590 [Eubacteriales bacterium]|nr:hypothetical protein [Eubacteriales bacterium]